MGPRWFLSPGSGDERHAYGEFDIEAQEVLEDDRPSENKRIVPLSREKPEYTAKSQLQMDLLMPNQPSPFKNSVYYVGESSSSSLLPSDSSFSTSQSTSSSRQSSFSHSLKPLSPPQPPPPPPPPPISNERGLTEKYSQQISQSSKVTAVREDSRRISLKKFRKSGHTFKKILDKQEIPKHATAWAIPIGVLIISINVKDRESMGWFIDVVALLVVVGLSMLIIGFFLQEEFESFAFGSTLLGFACFLGAFFFLFAYLLRPHNLLLASIPILCWIFIALLLFLGFINRESAPSPQNSGSDKVKTDTHKNIPDSEDYYHVIQID